jgi:sec-independent protein translocase protein TatB
LFLIILAILVFGPEKLPKMIQDAAQFLRKIREFSDSAKRDIRSELGPEFKDFEFEDLNPRTFAKKHLLDGEDLGLKELASDLDMRKELTEVTDAVNGRPATAAKNGSRANRLAKGGGTAGASGASGSAKGTGGSTGSGTGERVRLAKDGDAAPEAAPREDPPSFEADAT